MVLRREKIRRASISFIFVSASKIRALNKKYLSRAYATDVLAFDLSDEKSGELTGDIFISTDAAVKNARVYANSPSGELMLYIIHGLLHLLGYDDHRKDDIKKMRAKEREMLDLIGSGHRAILQP